MINQIEIVNYISKLRKVQKLTQGALAAKLGISYQAVSKWETGETLSDTGNLLKLTDILNTTTDKILSGGNLIIRTGKFISVEDVKQGIESLNNLKHLLGKNNIFYQGAIEGINKRMNINFEEMVQDETRREFLIGEFIIRKLLIVGRKEIKRYLLFFMKSYSFRRLNNSSVIKFTRRLAQIRQQ